MKKFYFFGIVLLFLVILLSSLFLYLQSQDSGPTVEMPNASSRVCNEYEYWEEVSDESPYPGMDCDEGPSKTIGVTVFIAKQRGSDEYIKPTLLLKNMSELDATGEGYTMEDAAEMLVSDLNDKYNPHGIGFVLRGVIYTEAESPQTLDKSGVNDYFEDIYGSRYNPDDLNVVFIPDYDFLSTSSASHPWNTGEALGRPRAYSLEHYVNIPYSTMVHEIGHFFGLLHTFWEGDSNDQEEWGLRGPHWVNPVQECHRTGDYVCDTPFDCISSEESCELDFDYSYPYSIMSYRRGNDTFSKEQGARARYYLNYRLHNNVNGNTLKEYEE